MKAFETISKTIKNNDDLIKVDKIIYNLNKINFIDISDLIKSNNTSLIEVMKDLKTLVIDYINNNKNEFDYCINDYNFIIIKNDRFTISLQIDFYINSIYDDTAVKKLYTIKNIKNINISIIDKMINNQYPVFTSNNNYFFDDKIDNTNNIDYIYQSGIKHFKLIES